MASFPKEKIKALFLGDGAWGTALAIILAEKGHCPTLWGNFPDNIEAMRRARVNEKFLPGFKLPENLNVTSELEEPLASADLLVASTPVVYLRSVLKKAAPSYRKELPVLCVAKGIEIDTHMPGSQVINDVLSPNTIGLMFGPSHAEEVARGLPATVVSASENIEFAEWIQEIFMTDTLRVYTSPDAVGAETGAALKNVIAIAAGICDGLGLGDNAKAALITRGLAEIARLGEAMGADRETFAGLTGLGDLITTCVSGYGRNLRVGHAIGGGKTLDQVLDEMGQVVAEGVYTTKSAVALADKMGVEMPITRQVYAVLYEEKAPAAAVRDLMMRDPKPEIDHHATS